VEQRRQIVDHGAETRVVGAVQIGETRKRVTIEPFGFVVLAAPIEDGAEDDLVVGDERRLIR
jgi:hypothetical protein